MNIRSVTIENFGRLSHQHIDFDKGINIEYRENGWGKSTLCGFLKAMFYGLEASASRDITKNERKRFAPWQGGAYGGSLVFETEAHPYRVTRFFHDRASEDEFELIDMNTGLTSDRFSKNLGEELFGINSESFLRTVFIGQSESSLYGATGDINARLGHIDDSLDLSRYAEADELLKDKLNEMSPTRKTGSIFKLQAEVTALGMEIKSYDGYESTLSVIEARISDRLRSIEDIKKQKTALKGQRSMAAAREKHQLILRQYEALEKEYQTREREYLEGLSRSGFSPDQAESMPDDASLNLIQDKISELSALRSKELQSALTGEEESKLEYYEGTFNDPVSAGENVRDLMNRWNLKSNIDREYSLLEKQYDDITYSMSEKKGGGYAVSVVAGIVLAVMGILSFVLKTVPALGFSAGLSLPVCAAITAAGSILLILGIIGIFRKKREKAMQEASAENIGNRLATLRKESDDTENEISRYLVRFGFQFSREKAADNLRNILLYADDYRHLFNKRESASKNDFGGKANTVSGEIKAFFMNWGVAAVEADYQTGLSKLRVSINTLKYLKLNSDDSRNKLEDFLNRENPKAFKEESADEPGISLEEIDRKLTEIEEEEDRLNDLNATDKRQAEELSMHLDELKEKEEEYLRLREKLSADNDKYSVLSKTREYLKTARDNLTAKYVRPLKEGFDRYYGIVSGKDPGAFEIDANAELSLLEGGKRYSTVSLSMGGRDLTGLCMRLAMIDAMYSMEKPVLIMDDPFVNFDDDNLAGGLSLLKKVSKDYQIIYMTCSDNRNINWEK